MRSCSSGSPVRRGSGPSLDADTRASKSRPVRRATTRTSSRATSTPSSSSSSRRIGPSPTRLFRCGLLARPSNRVPRHARSCDGRAAPAPSPAKGRRRTSLNVEGAFGHGKNIGAIGSAEGPAAAPRKPLRSASVADRGRLLVGRCFSADGRVALRRGRSVALALACLLFGGLSGLRGLPRALDPTLCQAFLAAGVAGTGSMSRLVEHSAVRLRHGERRRALRSGK